MISKTVKMSLAAMAIVGCFSIQAQQERRGRPSPEKVMTKKDADESGTISFEEFKAAPLNQDFKDDVVEKRFNRMDEDENGEVTMDELKKALKHMKHRRGHRPKPEDN